MTPPTPPPRRRRPRALAAGLALLLLGGAVALVTLRGDGGEAPSPADPGGPRHYPTAEAPHYLCLGEFTGDGRLDLAVAVCDADGVSLLPGQEGGLAPARLIPAGRGPTAVHAEDLDRDGKLDLVVTSHRDHRVDLLWGKGAGAFSRTSLATGPGSEPHDAVIVDLNRDRRLDLAVALGGESAVLPLLGDGRRSFAPGARLAVGKRPYALLAGDLNGDGRLDLVTSNFEGASVSVLLARETAGPPRFAPARHTAVGRGPNNMALARLNGDRALDLAVACALDGRLELLWGGGDGTLRPGARIEELPEATAVAATDLDGDGTVDLLGLSGARGEVIPLYAEAPGRYRRGPALAVGAGPSHLLVHDLDGDGRPELLVSNMKGASVTLWPLALARP